MASDAKSEMLTVSSVSDIEIKSVLDRYLNDFEKSSLERPIMFIAQMHQG